MATCPRLDIHEVLQFRSGSFGNATNSTDGTLLSRPWERPPPGRRRAAARTPCPPRARAGPRPAVRAASGAARETAGQTDSAFRRVAWYESGLRAVFVLFRVFSQRSAVQIPVAVFCCSKVLRDCNLPVINFRGVLRRIGRSGPSKRAQTGIRPKTSGGDSESPPDAMAGKANPNARRIYRFPCLRFARWDAANPLQLRAALRNPRKGTRPDSNTFE